MARHRASTPLPQSQRSASTRSADRTPSVRTVIIVFVVLLILFGWLHLILSLEIASTGRHIQLRTEELKEIERGNEDLHRRIAEALNSAEMTRRALEAGYQLQEPIYLPPQPVSRQP
jgi:hypothetical protein